jgi:hypothetical protein
MWSPELPDESLTLYRLELLTPAAGRMRVRVE